MNNTNVGNLVVRLNGDASNYQRMLASAQRMTTSAAASIAKALNPKIQFGSIEKLIAGAGIGAAVGQSVRLAAQAEQTSVAFSTMLGSAREASKLMNELQSFAAATPFELPEITQASKSLLAFGVEAQQIKPTLKMLGDLSSGIGIPLGELSAIYGKLITQGRLFADDLNQLQGRGLPLTKALAEQFKVPETEIRKLVEEGKVGFAQVQRAMASLTAEGSKFSGMMKAQSQTVSGQWSTLKDSINAALRSIGTSIIKTFDLAKVIENVGRFVTFVTDSWKELGLFTINSWSLMFVSLYESTKFFFVEQVWPLLRMYPTWWMETFKLVLANAAEFHVALWRAVRGQGWELHFAGYSEAFMQELAKIPSMADRPLTAWEIQMQKDLDMLARKMGKSWNRAFADEAKAQAAGAELKLAPVIDTKAVDKMNKALEAGNELRKKGKELMEQYLSPIEKQQRRLAELQVLYLMHAIDRKTYDMAAKASNKEYLDDMKELARVQQQMRNDAFMYNEAVVQGSREMYDAMQLVPAAYRPREAAKPTLGESAMRLTSVAMTSVIGDRAADRIVDELQELVTIGRKQLSKTVVEITGADL